MCKFFEVTYIDDRSQKIITYVKTKQAVDFLKSRYSIVSLEVVKRYVL